MKKDFREYDAEKDDKAVRRTWQECGWIDNIETDGIYVKDFFDTAEDALVALIDGNAECAVHSTKATMQYMNECLPMAALTAVTTSRISRKLGFAKALTAELISRQALRGHALSTLSMFDQGYYDLLGYGTGSYENWIKFDPASLIVDAPYRVPVRLNAKDATAMHSAMCSRMKVHGGAILLSAELFQAELKLEEKTFGLGYLEDGVLTHFIWCKSSGEDGPLSIKFMAYQNNDQFLELMSLIKAQGDQIHQISMPEPGNVQLQDLLRQPFRSRRMTYKAEFNHSSHSRAYWQARILDLDICIKNTKLPCEDFSFNLELSDPIEKCLPSSAAWRGIAGEYTITLGKQSQTSDGLSDGLPVLKASVNEFTRLWLGVRNATELTMTTELRGDEALIKKLDDALRLPSPYIGWSF